MAGDQKTEDHYQGLMTAVALAFMIVLVVVPLWYVKRAVLVDPCMLVFWLDYKLAWIFSPVATHLHMATSEDYETMRQYAPWVSAVLSGIYRPAQVTTQDLGMVCHNLFRFLAFPAFAFLVLIGFIAGFGNKGTAAPRRNFSIMGFHYGKVERIFGRKFPGFAIRLLNLLGFKSTKNIEKIKTGENFIKFQSSQWRTTVTSANFDVDRNDPNWAPALNGTEWCMAHGIKQLLDRPDFEAKCSQGLSRQIGKSIKTLEQLPTYARAILALAWLNLSSNVEDPSQNESYRLAGDLAELALPHQKFPEEKVRLLVDPILTKENIDTRDENNPINPIDFFESIFAKYTGWRTGMVACVGACGPFRKWGGGKSGIFAPASYLWLKGVDRCLFYALCNVGSPNYRIEGEGPIAQFWREKFSGERLPVDFSAAVNGIGEYFRTNGIVDLVEFSKQSRADQI